MSPTILTRGPDGKFIGYGQAIAAWLPILLSEMVPSMAIPEALDALAAWANQQAGFLHELAAGTLTDYPTCNHEGYVRRCAADAERWFKIRAAVLAAKEAVKNA